MRFFCASETNFHCHMGTFYLLESTIAKYQPMISQFLTSLLYCILGFFIVTSYADAQSEVSVTLGNLLQTYNGTARRASAVTDPAGFATQITYQNLNPNAPAPTTDVVFDDTPPTLALSYFSYGFSAAQISAVGNNVQLGGTSRKLESCDVILVNHAKAANWPTLSAANPLGYIHPIGIAIYELSPTNHFILRSEATQNILIPWRPLTQSNGEPYPFEGFAFRANIPFVNGITLPEKVLVVLKFNTQFYGEKPIGVDGPYNSLNVGYVNSLNTPLIGTDVNSDVVYAFRRGAWSIISGSRTSSVPMVRLYASSTQTITPPINAGNWQATAAISDADYDVTDSQILTVRPAAAVVQLAGLSKTYDRNPINPSVTTTPPGLPVSLTYNGSEIAPTQAGRYDVSATITNPNYSGNTNSTLEIAKATASVTLSNLVQIADGQPKSVAVTTHPPELATATTYSELSALPTALGRYAVSSVITDSNYIGSKSGELWLGQNLESWISPWLKAGSIPENLVGDHDDPDQDGIPNLLEYAFGLNPAAPDPFGSNAGSPQAQFSAGELSLFYSRNLAATDLDFKVESTSTLDGSGTWSTAVTRDSIISTEGAVQSIRATLPMPAEATRGFARVKVSRVSP